jgi:V8-like Glu-specific endopeptidase
MCKKLLILKTILLTILLTFLLSTNAYAVGTTTDQTTNVNVISNKIKATFTVQEVVAKNINAVLYLEIQDASGKYFASGSGFVVSKDGKIVTNFHNIENAYNIVAVTEDNKRFPIEGVVNYNKDADLAVLKIKDYNTENVVKLGNSDDLELGQEILNIGSPGGLEYKNSVTSGIISGFREGHLRKGRDIQTDCSINHGSSGSPIFNLQSEAVAIVYAGYEGAEGLSFCIPINDVKPMLELQAGEKIKTLPQMQRELLKIVTNEELSSYLIDKYLYCTANDRIFRFSRADIIDNPDNNEIFIFFNLDNINNIIYLDALIDNMKVGKKDIENWSEKIVKEVMEIKPDKDINFCIYFTGYFDAYPRLFDPSQIKYENGRWKVTQLKFIAANFGNKIKFQWLG